jgi:arylsulfatase A-like enzyme
MPLLPSSPRLRPRLRPLAVGMLSLLTAFMPLGARSLAAAPPNVLLIMVDDLGWGDLGSYGAVDLHTPHLDQLAAKGGRFTRFRANSSVCSPTRAALLTGRYPDQAGVPGVVRTHPANSWGYLAPDLPTLAEILGPAGYATALVGKWHLGLEAPHTPNDRGFAHFHGFLGDMMDDYWGHRRHGQNYLRLNQSPIDATGIHATDLFTRWARDYLEARAAGDSAPFFLFLSYNAPHDPVQPPAACLARVEARAPRLDPARARLVAFIEHLDHAIGEVLSTLAATGLAEQTLVIFTSDNGGRTDLGARNGPHRGGKGSMYEGGLAVPLIVRWPGQVPAGTVCDQLALTLDLFPTVLAAAGLPAPRETDGRDLGPVWRGEASPDEDRDLYFVRREGGMAYGGLTIQALRRGDWKLLQNSPYTPLELYHLGRDPQEQDNLAATEPARLQELSEALRRHIQAGGTRPWQPPPPGPALSAP